MSHLVRRSLVVGLLALVVAACGGDDSDEWSEGLRGAFMEECVAVAASLGSATPEPLCARIMDELQEELSEETYLFDLSQEDRDLAGAGLGVVCSTR